MPDNISNRRKNRIFAVQFLYSWDGGTAGKVTDIKTEIEDFFVNYFSAQKERYDFGREIIFGTISNIDIIDQLIQEHATHWTIDRIALVDLAILRVAIYEMLFREDVPPIVAINEAIEVSKCLSTDEAGKFLNGILEGVKQKLTRPLRHPGR